MSQLTLPFFLHAEQTKNFPFLFLSMKRHFFGPDIATALLLKAFEVGAEKVLDTLIVVPRHAHNQTSSVCQRARAANQAIPRRFLPLARVSAL